MFPRRLALTIPRRSLSTQVRPTQISRRTKTAIVSCATLTVTALVLLPSLHAEELASIKKPQLNYEVNDSPASLASLVRAYAVYSMCSVPFLVDNAPDILAVFRSIPGAKQLTDALVRATFFAQVCLLVFAYSFLLNLFDSL
jgi:proline dehydrogenase